jgi:hypothetical protein
MAIEEALYVVAFGDAGIGGSITPRNGGLSSLETGRIYGGDSGYYYIGSYQVEHGTITASVRIVKHNFAAANVFGDNAADFTVAIVGTTTETGIEGRIDRLGDLPGIDVSVMMIVNERLP